MTFFRKKPVVISAVQFKGDNLREVMEFTNGLARYSPPKGAIIIPTLEGDHEASKGDWIICGVKGEFYPCKPDIFAMTYEEAKPDTVEDQEWAECFRWIRKVTFGDAHIPITPIVVYAMIDFATDFANAKRAEENLRRRTIDMLEGI